MAEPLVVAPVVEVRQQLSRLLARFRRERAGSAPVVLGSHRQPEAVLLSYERYRAMSDELATLRARAVADGTPGASTATVGDMQPTQQVPAVLGDMGDPGAGVADPRQLLFGYLDWYRNALMRKIAGLSDEQVRTPVKPLGWSPLGLIKHLGWVERRWMRWGFAAEDVLAYPPGGTDAEWAVPANEPTASVMAAYRDEVERSRALAADTDLAEPARTGGRFKRPAEAPTLGRILFHLLQEYARHVGQLDVARELIDGETGE